jgi:hypothetical protein
MKVLFDLLRIKNSVTKAQNMACLLLRVYLSSSSLFLVIVLR